MKYKKTILAGSIGTFVEWAEFTFYGYLMTQFSRLFFPMFNMNVALLFAFGGFAVSYLARPLGAIIFGYIGDKKGRKKALFSSLLLMSAATFGISILPTYAAIGIYAPLLLIFFRFLQGVSVGGEFTGSAIFILEHNPPNAYLSSSWISTASAMGMLIGGFAAVIVTFPGMPEWSWRVPFFMGALACLIGFYIRYSLSETQLSVITINPLKTIFKTYKKPLLKVAAIGIAVALYIYICNIWWISYAINGGYFTSLTARSLALLAQGCAVIFTPLMAIVASRWNGKYILKAGLCGYIFLPPFIFLMTHYRSIYGAILMSILYALVNAAATAPMFKYFFNLFPREVRCTGIAFGWGLGVAIFGGSAPLVAQFFLLHHLTYLSVAYVAIGSVIALCFNREGRIYDKQCITTTPLTE